jgi:hypothetical protein
MICRIAKGAMWDPSVFWHDGRYHAVMVHNPDGVNGLDATRGRIGLLASGARADLVSVQASIMTLARQEPGKHKP